MDSPEFIAGFEGRRIARMARIDAMPPEMRALVNDYGLTIVDAFHQSGVVKAKRIRNLVETVLNEFSPTRGSFSCQGVRTIHDANVTKGPILWPTGAQKREPR